MGYIVPKELEAKCLAMAAQRPGVVPESPPTFADEGKFQAAVIAKAKESGWLCYHTYNSKRSAPGFPDLIMLRALRMIAGELKRDKKEQPSAAQKKWLKAFQRIPGVDVRVWSPEDWDTILKELA